MGDAKARLESKAVTIKSVRKERSGSKAQAKPDYASMPKRRSSRVAGLAAASEGLPKQVSLDFHAAFLQSLASTQQSGGAHVVSLHMNADFGIWFSGKWPIVGTLRLGWHLLRDPTARGCKTCMHCPGCS